MTTETEIDESEVNTTMMRLLWVAHHDHMKRLALSHNELSVLQNLAESKEEFVSINYIGLANSNPSISLAWFVNRILSSLMHKAYINRTLIDGTYFYSIKEEFKPHILEYFDKN